MLKALNRLEYCIEQWLVLAQSFRYNQRLSRGVAQFGSARGLGPRGRRFKSCLPDHDKALMSNQGFFSFVDGVSSYLLDDRRKESLYSVAQSLVIIV